VIESLRRVAAARESVAAALEAADERKARRLEARFEPYLRRLSAAVRESALGAALSACTP
jgi:hypothetical protein